jgi:hypothetical protein
VFEEYLHGVAFVPPGERPLLSVVLSGTEKLRSSTVSYGDDAAMAMRNTK